MIKNKSITSNKVKVKVRRRFLKSEIYLVNATTYEQNVYSDCISQMFGSINQPRYLLAKPKFIVSTEFYVVPEIFKKNKSSALILAKQMKLRMGLFDLVFAKNENRKNEVLRASKLYYFKYKKVEIDTKNILLSSPLRKRR